MKIVRYLFCLVLLLLGFSVVQVYAQVTVGSDIPSRKGSVLDIKDKDATGNEPNAVGGLGLPRVKLTSPTTLTVAKDSENIKSTGITVYHTGNANMPAGVYTWNGNRWMLSVSVDDYGTSNQFLKSNGFGNFGWSTLVVPEYEYYKPTQISVLKSANVKRKSYSYQSLTNGGIGSWGGEKPSAKFDYLYSDALNILSETANERYLLIGIAATTRTTTRNNNVPAKSYWQIVGIDIDLTDKNGSNVMNLQKKQRLYKTASGSALRSYIDFFTIIPITGVGKGVYTLNIKVYNVENTFSRNTGSEGGGFIKTEESFYDIDLVDINFILYEDD